MRGTLNFLKMPVLCYGQGRRFVIPGLSMVPCPGRFFRTAEDKFSLFHGQTNALWQTSCITGSCLIPEGRTGKCSVIPVWNAFHQPCQGWLNGFRHEALPFRVGVQGAGFFPLMTTTDGSQNNSSRTLPFPSRKTSRMSRNVTNGFWHRGVPACH